VRAIRKYSVKEELLEDLISAYTISLQVFGKLRLIGNRFCDSNASAYIFAIFHFPQPFNLQKTAYDECMIQMFVILILEVKRKKKRPLRIQRFI